MTIREAFERVAKGNFNNGYGFDLQMLVDCMGILSKAINNWEIIPTQAIEDAIAEIQAEITENIEAYRMSDWETNNILADGLQMALNIIDRVGGDRE